MKRMRTIGLALTVSAVGVGAFFVWFRSERPRVTSGGLPSASNVASPLPAPSTSASAAVSVSVAIADADAGADADASPSPECAALDAHNKSTLARFNFDNPVVDCVTTRAGVTWGYRITNVAQAGDAFVTTTLTAELVRQDSKGTRAIPGAGATLEYNEGTKKNSMALVALGDYDGDGEEEILRVHYSQQREGELEQVATVLTFKSDKLAPYAPASAIAIDDTEDVDGDGKRDLLTLAPYQHITTASAVGSSQPALDIALFVAHALPDGTFSRTDSVAIAFTRRQCPSPAKVSFTQDETGNVTMNAPSLPKQIVCARLWGTPEAEIVKMWDAVCAGDASPNPYSCQSWPKDLASVTPPFTLK